MKRKFWERAVNEKGLSLISMLIAAAVILISLITLSQVLPVAMRAVYRSEKSSIALNHARERLEYIASRADDYFYQVQPVTRLVYPGDNNFEYAVNLDNVTEDGDENIISTLSELGTQKVSGLKKVTVTLYWTEQGQAKSISAVSYISGKNMESDHINTGIISGIVSNEETSAGIGNATVTAVSTTLSPAKTYTANSSTNVGSEGSYVIIQVVPDTYYITCAATGFYSPATQSQVVASGGNYLVDFSLEPSSEPYKIVALTPSNTPAGAGSAMVLNLEVQSAADDVVSQNVAATINIIGQVGGGDDNSVKFTNTTMTGVSGLNTKVLSGTIVNGQATVTINDTESEQITVNPVSSGLLSVDATGIFTDAGVGSAYKIVLLPASPIPAGQNLTYALQVQDANGNIVLGTYHSVGVAVADANATARITATTMTTSATFPTTAFSGTSTGNNTITITDTEAENVSAAAICAALTISTATQTYTFTSTNGTISGTVTDTNSAPVTGATITIHDQASLIPDYTTTTNGSGYYTMSVASGKTYTVSVAKTQYETKSTADTSIPSPGSAATVNFSIQQYGTISGTVRDNASNDPIFYATVTITIDANATFTVYTDANGFYSKDVPPGNCPVQATMTGYQASTTTTVPVTAGATTSGVDFNLDQNPCSVTGTVTYYKNAANPNFKAAGAIITICDALGNASSLTATASSVNGSYTINGVPAGEHTVKFQFGTYTDYLSEVMTFASGSTYQVNHHFQ